MQINYSFIKKQVIYSVKILEIKNERKALDGYFCIDFTDK